MLRGTVRATAEFLLPSNHCQSVHSSKALHSCHFDQFCSPAPPSALVDIYRAVWLQIHFTSIFHDDQALTAQISTSAFAATAVQLTVKRLRLSLVNALPTSSFPSNHLFNVSLCSSALPLLVLNL